MGFINTEIRDRTIAVANMDKDKRKSPYYKYSEYMGTTVTYYSQHHTLSSLDEGNNKAYADRGKDSPIKFKRILDMMVYGIDRIEIQMNLSEMGVSSDDITGQIHFLPGFEPIPNDYFTIDYLGDNFIFKILSVNKDTIDDNTELYTAEYKFDKSSDPSDTFNVVEQYRMIVDNAGTEFKSIILESDYDLISVIEQYILTLQTYYSEIFFNKRVESFIFNLNGYHLYDPYLTEFIIKNKLMEGSTHFMYIQQQIKLEPLFPLNYDKTIFNKIEKISKDISPYILNYELVDEPLSLLCMRSESYHRLSLNKTLYSISALELLDQQFVDSITDQPIEADPSIIIWKYLHGEDISKTDLDLIENNEFTDSSFMYYLIPIIIFILKYYTIQIVSNKH